MARQPMVTRTIVSTKVKALCMDLINRQPIEKTFVLARTYKDDNAVMKMLCKEYDSEELKVTAILEKVETKEIYGMSETRFVELADKLDDDRKPIKAETETENEY